MATPWPDKPCPHCQQTITDLLSEMVPDPDQATPDYKTLNNRQPGGAIACPYCQEAVEYDRNGQDLVASSRPPLRSSRAKTEDRARKYGQVFLSKPDATPEEWLADDKGMDGALRGYRYAEDPRGEAPTTRTRLPSGVGPGGESRQPLRAPGPPAPGSPWGQGSDLHPSHQGLGSLRRPRR